MISDVRNADPASSREPEEEQDHPAQSERSVPEDEGLIFKFDLSEIDGKKKAPALSNSSEYKATLQSQDSILSDLKSLNEVDEIEREIARKAEERKRVLMSLLDENKSVLQNMKSNSTKSEAVEEVSWKTSSQLQSMEELRIPDCSRSPSSSPERHECRSEPIVTPFTAAGSLDSVKSLDDIDTNIIKRSKKRRLSPEKSRISSAQKLKQISGKVKEDAVQFSVIAEAEDSGSGASNVPPIAICVTTHEGENLERNVATTLARDSENVELSPKSTRKVDIGRAAEDGCTKKQRDLQKVTKFSEEIKEESLIKTETEASTIIPLRKLEKKKRDDSLESTTASVKSSVQLSDTGSLLSHR